MHILALNMRLLLFAPFMYPSCIHFDYGLNCETYSIHFLHHLCNGLQHLVKSCSFLLLLCIQNVSIFRNVHLSKMPKMPAMKKVMLTKLKLFFLSRDHKNRLWSQLLFFETSFRLFRFLDIYKCPKTSFPKKSCEKKHKFAKKTINGKVNLKTKRLDICEGVFSRCRSVAKIIIVTNDTLCVKPLACNVLSCAKRLFHESFPVADYSFFKQPKKLPKCFSLQP